MLKPLLWCAIVICPWESTTQTLSFPMILLWCMPRGLHCRIILHMENFTLLKPKKFDFLLNKFHITEITNIICNVRLHMWEISHKIVVYMFVSQIFSRFFLFFVFLNKMYSIIFTLVHWTCDLSVSY